MCDSKLRPFLPSLILLSDYLLAMVKDGVGLSIVSLESRDSLLLLPDVTVSCFVRSLILRFFFIDDSSFFTALLTAFISGGTLSIQQA